MVESRSVLITTVLAAVVMIGLIFTVAHRPMMAWPGQDCDAPGASQPGCR